MTTTALTGINVRDVPLKALESMHRLAVDLLADDSTPKHGSLALSVEEDVRTLAAEIARRRPA